MPPTDGSRPVRAGPCHAKESRAGPADRRGYDRARSGAPGLDVGMADARHRDLDSVPDEDSGNAQLRVDEERRWLAKAVELAAAGEAGAVAAIVALLMGMRASEIVERVVRDVDGGGRLLWGSPRRRRPQSGGAHSAGAPPARGRIAGGAQTGGAALRQALARLVA